MDTTSNVSTSFILKISHNYSFIIFPKKAKNLLINKFEIELHNNFQTPTPAFRPELATTRYQGPFLTDHDYQTHQEARLGGEIGKKLNKCQEGVDLVIQMESALQDLHLLPKEESTDPGLLKLESQFLDIWETR